MEDKVWKIKYGRYKNKIIVPYLIVIQSQITYFTFSLIVGGVSMRIPYVCCTIIMISYIAT